jgi:PAS domain S-box-containing protein
MPIFDESRKVIEFQSIGMDIHERKQAENKLRASEEKYRLISEELEARVQQRTAEVHDLYNNAPTGYHSLDIEGRYIEINQTELDWLGYTREEVLGRSFTQFITEESARYFNDVTFNLFKKTGKVANLEYEMCRKDGSTFPALLNAVAIMDEQGNYLRSRSTIFDNTERRKAENDLRESEAVYRALFEMTNEAIFLIDPKDTCYVQVNPCGKAILGFAEEEELIGRSAGEFIVPEQLPDARQHMQRLLAGEQLTPYERTFIRKDGTLLVTELALSLIRDGNGKPKLLQSMVRDITQRKQAEEALRQANIELERVIRMKDEFLASMSHELRTPLTGILGITESLLEQIYGPLSDKQVRAINNVDVSGRHLLELINDILDVAKMESGKFELQMAPFSLPQVCQSSLQLIRGIANKKKQKVTFRLHPTDIQMIGDSRRIKQVIVNLLSNAVKYTPAGGSIGLEVEGDQDNQVICLTVWDTGIGVKPEDMEKLFQPFVQIDSSLSRQQNGTGLGLTLVQSLVDLHGGSLQVESSFGHGSRFTASLPWNDSKDVVTEQEAQPAALLGVVADESQMSAPSRALIMVVDDNEINILTLHDFLTAKNYRVVSATNGWAFLEQVGTLRPDVVLMDIQMPGMDGLEAIRQMRAHPDEEVAKTLIMAVTALAMPGDRERCLQAGANEYLSKPIRLSQLAVRIEELISVTP